MARKQSISSEMIDKQLDDHFLDKVNEDDDSGTHVPQGSPLQLRSPEKNDVSFQKESASTTDKMGSIKKPINVYTNPANGPVTLKLDSRQQVNVTVSGASSDCDGTSENSSSRLMGGGSNNGSVRDSSKLDRERTVENDNKLELKRESVEENGSLKQLGEIGSTTDRNKEDCDSSRVTIPSDAECVSEVEQKGDSSRSCLLDNNKETYGAS